MKYIDYIERHKTNSKKENNLRLTVLVMLLIITILVSASWVIKDKITIKDLKKQFDELVKNPVSVSQTAFLEREILPTTRKCGLPDALVAGQWALESGRATTSPINNFFGIGPGWRFNTVSENVK